jgi:hypothetical protein
MIKVTKKLLLVIAACNFMATQRRGAPETIKPKSNARFKPPGSLSNTLALIQHR